MANEKDSIVQFAMGMRSFSGITKKVEREVGNMEERFTDNGDGTVTDNLTGLMWLKDTNYFGQLTWQEALDAITNLSRNLHYDVSGGKMSRYTDWRLPTTQELIGLIDYSQYNPALPPGHPFKNVEAGWYWSSTTCVHTGYAWLVGMWDGSVGNDAMGNGYYVWPVRGQGASREGGDGR